MVGGYLILTKKPLEFGENDIGAMYGSIENANKRVDTLPFIKKPLLVEYNLAFGGVINKLAAWFELENATSTTVTASSKFFTLTYNRSTGIATLNARD